MLNDSGHEIMKKIVGADKEMMRHNHLILAGLLLRHRIIKNIQTPIMPRIPKSNPAVNGGLLNITNTGEE